MSTEKALEGGVTSSTEEHAGSRHAILDDPELEGLSLYEKKALLVNRELDSHGMGKYQWWIFFLCGFGYFLDLMWAQAFGLVATPLENELGFPSMSAVYFRLRGDFQLILSQPTNLEISFPRSPLG